MRRWTWISVGVALLWVAGLVAPVGSQSANVFGNGTNMLWIEPDHDLVVVVRWLGDVDGFIATVLQAFPSTN